MQSLGINLVGIIINSLLFFCFLALLHKVLFSKLETILHQRKTKVLETQELHKTVQELLENSQADAKKLLEDARTEYQTILKEAKTAAYHEAELIMQKAHQEEKRLLQKSKSLLDFKFKELEEQFQQVVKDEVKQSLTLILKDQADKIDVSKL